MFRDAMCGEHGGDRKSDVVIKSNNVTLDTATTGNSLAYTLFRLSRESPELFQAVCRKELSANAAGAVRRDGGGGSRGCSLIPAKGRV